MRVRQDNGPLDKTRYGRLVVHRENEDTVKIAVKRRFEPITGFAIDVSRGANRGSWLCDSNEGIPKMTIPLSSSELTTFRMNRSSSAAGICSSTSSA